MLQYLGQGTSIRDNVRITNFSNNEKMTFTKARMLCVKYNFYDSERLPGLIHEIRKPSHQMQPSNADIEKMKNLLFLKMKIKLKETMISLLKLVPQEKKFCVSVPFTDFPHRHQLSPKMMLTHTQLLLLSFF